MNTSKLPIIAILASATILPNPLAGAASPEEPTRYMIVVTGGELLEGAFPDAHTHYLTRTLRPLGLRCIGSITIDDEIAEIRAALQFATGRADLVIVTGGLGPTQNDFTCDALADFTGIPVEEHPQVLEAVARRFRTPVDGLRANLRRQTRVPVGGSFLPNPHGTAVGIVFETEQAVLVALPGPPRELEPMVRDQLAPFLSRRFGTRLPGSSLTVRFVGIGQSSVDQAMREHLPLDKDIVVSSYFDGTRVDFTFALPEENANNQVRLKQLREGILRHLGEYVYATDAETSLEDSVLRALGERGVRLSIAEIASGGAVTAALRGADGAGALAGALVAGDTGEMCGLLRVAQERWSAVSPGTGQLELLAESCAQSTGGDWALVIGPPQPGAEGRSSTQVVLRREDGRTSTAGMTAPGTDRMAQSRLATQVIDFLRKESR